MNDTITELEAIEYFIDTDPGFGSGVPIPINPTFDTLNLPLAIDISGIPGGVHRLVVRSRDGLGQWSLSNEFLFIVDDLPLMSDSIPEIVGAEYFIGTDPGFGNAVSIPITPYADISNLSFAVDVSDVPNGIHRLVVRTKNAFGQWSLSNEWILVIGKLPPLSDTIPELVSLEYFIDTSGGFGEGIQIPLPSVTNAQNIVFSTDIYSLLSGSHTISLRSKDADGNWSFLNQDTFVYYYHDLGIDSLVLPQTGCELSSTETVTVNIKNIGGLPETGFDIAYSVNGGPPVIENVDTLQLSLGFNSVHYTFNTPANLSALGSYTFEVYPLLPGDRYSNNDTLTFTVTNYPPLYPVSNMFPQNGATNIDKPLVFSWQAATNATHYDLYVWHDTASIPSTPIEANITQIAYFFYQNFPVFGETYKWQVYSKTAFCQTPGPIQSFTLRELPDLIVNNVQVPVSPFSGQQIQVSWQIENQGLGNTLMDTWVDVVYLSLDTILDPIDDLYLGGFPYLTALNAGHAYAQSVQVTLPQNMIGPHYLIVSTNHYEEAKESDQDNNVSFAPINIQLTPPPDLQVSSVVVPSNTFSGQDLNVTWTVKNEGQGPTTIGQWQDKIYLDSHLVFNPLTAIPLGTFQYNDQALEIDSSYSQSQSVFLPVHVFGDYYIHVETDATNLVYENAFESNNTSPSNPLAITLTPPPDLAVTSVLIPDSVSNFESVSIEWTIFNQGASAASSTWVDRVYIGSDSVFNVSSAIFLVDKTHNTPLGLNESYTQHAVVPIPPGINGKYFMYIRTDHWNDVFEYTSENNNTFRSDSIEILSPDLTVVNFSAPDTAYSGKNVLVQWNAKNEGYGNLIGQYRKDKLFFSSHSVFHPDSVTALGSVGYNTALAPGQQVSKQLSVSLPNGISGTYYLYLITDSEGDVYEAGSESNNIVSGTLEVLLSPPPDLVVSSIELLPDSSSAGMLQSVRYTVNNIGQGNVSAGQKTDWLSISDSPVWDQLQATTLKYIPTTGAVPSNGSYVMNTNFIFPLQPGQGNSGVRYIYVYTDVYNNVYETPNEENNVLRSDPIFVMAPPPIDLKIENVNALPDTLISGSTQNMQWVVRNEGSTTSIWPFDHWYDGIFLSQDTTWDENDIFVKQWAAYGPVAQNETYTKNKNYTLPVETSGDYYFLMVADHQHLINDGDTTNNIILISNLSDTGTFKTPIHITLSPSADLTIDTFINPLQGVIGQPVEVIWSVTNTGNISTNQPWTDKIYLSTDFNIDYHDQIIGTLTRSTALAPGESYTDTLQVNLTSPNPGNYILLVKTDANNSIQEVNGENNNSAYSFISIIQPPPADLIVSNLSVPDSAIVNKQMSIDWTIKNEGQFPANGVTRDILYFSIDSIFDISDIPIGTFESSSIYLAPQAESNRTLSATTPGLPLGDYHLIVLADALNNIYESTDTNNVFISPGKITVTIDELPIGISVNDTMVNEQNLYYRIEIPDTLEGETLKVSLQGDSLSGINELYLSHGLIPTRSSHEFAHSNAFQPDQNIVIPSLQNGTYYLLAFGLSSTGDFQNIELQAQIIDFEVISITSNKGGNTGNVTVEVKGAKFEEDMEMRLNDPVLGTIIAQNVSFINSTKVFVTFNLSGAGTGVYDLVAEKQNNDIAILDEGFEVVLGDAGSVSGGGGNFNCSIVNIGFENQLANNLQYPFEVRRNRIVPITIQFGNTGNVDIPVPARFLISTQGAPLAMIPEDLAQNKKTLYLEFREIDGPEDVLRPGVSSSLTVYSYASDPLLFILTE
ncbi:MAG: CARDB domain-containing protein [Saprospiraceae bacterium]